MATKLKVLGLERDYKQYLYYIDTIGNVCRKRKMGVGQKETEILVPAAVQREKHLLYFIDKDGDISCAERAVRAKPDPAATVPAATGTEG